MYDCLESKIISVSLKGPLTPTLQVVLLLQCMAGQDEKKLRIFYHLTACFLNLLLLIFTDQCKEILQIATDGSFLDVQSLFIYCAGYHGRKSAV